ncbi:proton-conducting transporter transmembrane domain-containing protein, partial [Thermococcus sp.]
IDFPVVGKHWGDIVIASGVALALATWAFLIKAAVFPNHFWLPEAHPAAPSPISAVLSGLVVNVGVYSLARFVYTVYGGTLSSSLSSVVHSLAVILMFLGAISALFGALMMLIQNDVKRLIAYSTVMHMGYLVMAVGVGSQLALGAALFHMVNHAVAKALLFLSAGVFIHAAGSRDIEDLAGLGRRMPVVTFSLAIASFSLAGVPPFNVFFSKLLLFNAFMEKSFWLALVLVFSSVIALVAYIRVFYEVWLGEPKKKLAARESWSMSGVCLIIAIACIVLGLVAPYVVTHYINPAAAQAVNYKLYIQKVLILGEKIKIS